MMRITILGSVPAKKNSRAMAFNRKTGHSFPVQNKIAAAWERSALLQLLEYKGIAEKKVTIHYTFYVPNNVARDLDNMIATVNDALVKRGLLKDDSWQWLRIGGADGQIDRENPRVVCLVEEDS